MHNHLATLFIIVILAALVASHVWSQHDHPVDCIAGRAIDVEDGQDAGRRNILPLTAVLLTVIVDSCGQAIR